MADSNNDIANILPSRLPTDNSQRLLLFGIRRIASAGLNDAHAASAFIGAFGLGFRRPLVLLRALMAEMSRVSNRKVIVAPCCCPRMTEAESVLIGAVTFAILDPHQAHRALTRALGVENCLGALSSAQALGQAFEDLGRPLNS